MITMALHEALYEKKDLSGRCRYHSASRRPSLTVRRIPNLAAHCHIVTRSHTNSLQATFALLVFPGLEYAQISTAEVLMDAYCFKCRTKREIRNPSQVTLKNGRPDTQGTYPTCGTKMFRIGKGQNGHPPQPESLAEVLKGVAPLNVWVPLSFHRFGKVALPSEELRIGALKRCILSAAAGESALNPKSYAARPNCVTLDGETG